MRFDIRHVTQYQYDEPVRESVMELWMQPRAGFGQRLVDFDLEVDPHAQAFSYPDAWGNVVRHFDVPHPHSKLTITARSTVEIDALANENAEENARLNAVDGRIRFQRALPDSGERYPLVLANILKPVLLEFRERLCARLAPEGTLILSGLIEPDVEPVRAAYLGSLPGYSVTVLEAGEWRALVWKAPA